METYNTTMEEELGMTTTRRQHVADVVRAARAFHGMTQSELAAAVGVHTQTIGNLERASVETSPDLIASLERVLKIDLSPAALAGSASADVIRRELIRRFAELSESDGLVLAGETLRFILNWSAHDSSDAPSPAIWDVGLTTGTEDVKMARDASDGGNGDGGLPDELRLGRPVVDSPYGDEERTSCGG